MKKQTGFSLVSAIFIVVVLALIGSYIVSIGALTNASTNLATLGVKAYYAAKSGLEWGIYEVTTGSFVCPAASTTLTLTQGGLAGLSVKVDCTSASFVEHSITYNTFQITATGTYGTASNPDFVSRQLYTTVIQPGI